MEKNQSKGAPSTWFAASQYLFPDGVFRTGSLGSEGSLFFSYLLQFWQALFDARVQAALDTHG
jgi:hypothetical protein